MIDRPSGTQILLCLLAILMAAGCAAHRAVVENTPQPAQFIRIEPAGLELRPGDIRQFHALGVAPDGYEVILPDVNWTVDGGGIDHHGTFKAPSGPDVVMIGAAWGGIHGHTTVKILVSDESDSLYIAQPEGITAGRTHQFRAFRRMSNGGEMEVQAVWDAGIGWIDETGLYTAPQRSGPDHVTARADGHVAAVTFPVRHRPAVLLWVKPSRAVVPYNGGQKFEAFGVDEFGNLFPAEARFSVDQGSITVDGAYTPSQDNVQATVTATAGHITGRAELTVTR